jgi:KDO2-lipid IV(A) lauroyltransferase
MAISKYLRGAGTPRSSRAQRIVLRVTALVVSAVWWLLGRLSPDRASALGAAAFRAIGPHLYKMPNVRRNLELAFPERSPAAIEALARDVWANFGAVFAEFAHFETLCGPEADAYVEFVMRGKIRALTEGARPAIFVSAHLANFNLAAFAAGRMIGEPLTVVYASEPNPWIDRAIAERRERLGCRLVPRDRSVRRLIKELQAGHSLGFVADTRSEGAEMLPFFGIEAATSIIPARLAIRFGCELIPARVERLHGARFRFTLYDPIVPPEPNGDEREQARAMTRELLGYFENWIRERPGEWWCTSRRWPKDAKPTASQF